jgi:acyl carrier protein
MFDVTDRLIRCFKAVFPNVPTGQIPAASADNVPEWDSLAAVTLIALLEQEFGIQVDFLALPELTSFEAFRNYLGTQHHFLS